jgi:hypothetical protein
MFAKGSLLGQPKFFTTTPRSGRGGRRFKSCHSDQHVADFKNPLPADIPTETILPRVALPVCSPEWKSRADDPTTSNASPSERSSVSAFIQNGIGASAKSSRSSRTATFDARGRPSPARPAYQRKSGTASRTTRFRMSAPNATTAGPTCPKSAPPWRPGIPSSPPCLPRRRQSSLHKRPQPLPADISATRNLRTKVELFGQNHVASLPRIPLE